MRMGLGAGPAALEPLRCDAAADFAKVSAEGELTGVGGVLAVGDFESAVLAKVGPADLPPEDGEWAASAFLPLDPGPGVRRKERSTRALSSACCGKRPTGDSAASSSSRK